MTIVKAENRRLYLKAEFLQCVCACARAIALSPAKTAQRTKITFGTVDYYLGMSATRGR